ncbi:DUF1583 domain-containing protein [Synechococcus phage ACG-2014d]|jgi:hypothetical protein|uniref:DUF1583 domain-containing protein n=1 Tax=Synechococcus phage ACG-2014d TaxID=1493509 RepID=A0A0E3EME6_9CAUD|nr:DUF1583 domain-containing protein [Synechococcus phage ACG-2014d]YP_010355311.1 DUF1583 domain-containing protein [Synechococcus phage ACG-2014d]AIX14753.1 DUF1583 domain-containing protein [Synechococcus phage ACG-2014d]AIX14972.1 DUF1583 domain-containing protein [Synechococcus phage ACG-2014d]AIX15399.1 DUF1583 domain-containing protein [Synechococcus phage ACG-2014d]AIX15618.1 DUF1583 domain-containing protein [Synechococcus phage ACG-2014d]AIX16047.1 DUF1583 domain-containing protein 
MNFYYNCSPPGYSGEREILTVELPSYMMEDILEYARNVAYQNDTHTSKVLKNIVNETISTISHKNYVRKNRKTKKR